MIDTGLEGAANMHPVMKATLAYVETIEGLKQDIDALHGISTDFNWKECVISTAVAARCEVPEWVEQAATGAQSRNEEGSPDGVFSQIS